MSNRWRRSAAVVVVAAAGLVGPVAHANAGPVASPTGQGRTITLVTGDQVVLTATGHAVVRAAEGREHVGFLTRTDVNGDVSVTPFDALGPLRDGRLDPRLFNVTRLLDSGYGDAERGDIPLIVTRPGNLNARTVRALPSIGGAAVLAVKDTAFWNTRDATRIWLDGPVHALLDRSVPQIGAPAAWQAGHTGKGTTVAVLDTGIQATHPDLADAVTEAKDFTGSASGTADKHGHGTHVASIVTGGHPKYQGVAPDTRLLVGKVLNDAGSGTESGIIAGMEWAAAGGAQVINMSLGGDAPSDGTDPLSQAVNELTARTGALFVIASGNSGRTPGSPAAADAALTVGAVDHTDALAGFSSRGPRLRDNAIKPDITAPGVDIVAALARDSLISRLEPPVGEDHVALSGTSMATPHVAGAAAILAGRHPEWKAPQLKAALMGTAKPNPALTAFEQGAGRVDVAKAVTTSVHASVASINNGVVQWPHTDDVPVTTAVTYHNSGTSPVTLALATEVEDPNGKAAPAGMFTVAPATLTIAPGASAQATVTTDTKAGGADGIYSGVVTAGDLRTPITVTREVESYDLKVNVLGTDGKPTPDYAFRLVDLSKPESRVPYESSGSLTVRAPKGHYYFESQVSTSDRLAVAVEPDVDLGAATTITVDARQGRPAGLVLDRRGAKAGQKFVEFSRSTSYGGKDHLRTTISPPEYGDVLVSPSKTSAPGRFRYSVGGRFAEKDATGSFDASPYLYNVRGDVDGRMPVDPVLRLRDKDLVKVRTTHGATTSGTTGTREGMITKPLPYVLEELYSPETPWFNDFSEMTAAGEYRSRLFSSAPTSFPRGRTATDSFNLAVFGPDLPSNPGRPTRYASRSTDTMVFQIPLFADSGRDREGFSAHTGSSTLYRDGVEIGRIPSTSGLFAAGSGPATYRLHTEATRDRTLTSEVVADWTFTSDTVAEGPARPLPLMAVKFTPAVDGHNRASRLSAVVPLSVSHNTGIAARPTGVQVSYDRGATWRAAPLVGGNGRWAAVLSHPRGAVSVSLKASARDTAGNSVTQTVIDAFLLK
ncbi:S8 family peptidase [Lentzea albida]|uniref:Serine protease, subtilisin family n=1 Tax=Lentzea albida TaxID=65499 RepID=A0A1H9WFJ4_9PSEU|nr:S8 family serine peptidase [Lentzea albida]SES32604.1 Serine protease, subtilisin family [Lentzea albida]